eukprot:scaffold77206_cov37-Prasinocladus_malaysianus.AAC.1
MAVARMPCQALEADRKELERRSQQIKWSSRRALVARANGCQSLSSLASPVLRRDERAVLEDMRAKTYAELNTMREELGQVQIQHTKVKNQQIASLSRCFKLDAQRIECFGN